MMPPGANAKNITVGLVIGQLSIGGAERQIYELAAGLAQSGVYRPVVICSSNYRNPNGLLLERADIPVVYLDVPLNYAAKLAWTRKKLRENHCQIAYAFLNPTNVYCWLACIGTGIKFIASVRGLPRLNFLFRLGLKAALAGADWIIANSESGKQWAVNTHRADPKKITVIENAVRPFSPSPAANGAIRAGLGIAGDEIVIGLVSIVKSTKRPDFVLEVAADFLKNHPRIHFIWVGDGPLYSEMVLKRDSFPVEIKSRIHFVGAKDNIGDWLSVFSIYMLVSYSEGLSNSLMEAMFFGLPCICSDVPGIVDIIKNRHTGILVPNNKSDWVESLGDLVQNAELARFIGQNARNQMLNYSPAVFAEETSAVFDLVLSKNLSEN